MLSGTLAPAGTFLENTDKFALHISHSMVKSAVLMQKMLFVAVLLCDIYANCADIMQVVLLLCKL